MAFFIKKRNAQQPPFLFVGLGNPGIQYQRTRHNVGFWALEALAQAWGVSVTKSRAKALVGEAKVGDQRVVLVLPQTYMNLSGQSVNQLMQWYKVPPARVAVLYDDVDLPAGRIRVRPGGSAGTHNGMRSIITECGMQDFPRIRIGIGPKPPMMELADYVLAKLKDQEYQVLEQAAQTAAKAAQTLLNHGVEQAMAEFNVKTPAKE